MPQCIECAIVILERVLNAASCRAVSKGDRVAQLILERIATPEVLEVTDLEATIRGAGGYGSTGIGAA